MDTEPSVIRGIIVEGTRLDIGPSVIQVIIVEGPIRILEPCVSSHQSLSRIEQTVAEYRSRDIHLAERMAFWILVGHKGRPGELYLRPPGRAMCPTMPSGAGTPAR